MHQDLSVASVVPISTVLSEEGNLEKLPSVGSGWRGVRGLEEGGSSVSGSRLGMKGVCVLLSTTLKEALARLMGQLNAAWYVLQVEHCRVWRLLVLVLVALAVEGRGADVDSVVCCGAHNKGGGGGRVLELVEVVVVVVQ